jgi:formylglycine-generating enzyme required for sulfatase activity
LDDHDEDALPLPPIATFEPPAETPPRPQQPLALSGWPFSADEAAARQQSAGPAQRELDLGADLKMRFQLVPAGEFVMGDVRGFADECAPAIVQIDRPFYLGQFEVTNAQYAQFDPAHNSGVIDERWKDRTRRGTPIDAPDQPVVRISWQQAMAFCEWLSARTGMRCTLPTEAQWEWACRAGTDTTFAAGHFAPPMRPFANIADGSIQSWNHGRAEANYQDGIAFTAPGGRFPANAWGLHDMHGNVAEWCLSTYLPYPYRSADGRDDANRPGPKVVRGGSWNETLKYATSASRWRYDLYKPVHNVGFRVLCQVAGPPTVARATSLP